MARIDTLTNFLTDVADSIRSKTGKSDAIACEDFDTEIESIETGGGEKPEKGYVLGKFNSDGFPTEVTTYGLTTLPAKTFYVNSKNNPPYFFLYIDSVYLNEGMTTIGTFAFNNCINLIKINLPSGFKTLGESSFNGCTNLTTINLPDGINTIGNSAFNNCANLTTTNLPNSMTTMGAFAFNNCTNLFLTTIPDGVTELRAGVFFKCTSLKKISMRNVNTIIGNKAGNASFGNCTGLKQVWIGSAIKGNSSTPGGGFAIYSFNGCTNLEKMYIDLPRTTVETFVNYQYAFMNDTSKTGIIICNDDADFITKEEFDALEIE